MVFSIKSQVTKCISFRVLVCLCPVIYIQDRWKSHNDWRKRIDAFQLFFYALLRQNVIFTYLVRSPEPTVFTIFFRVSISMCASRFKHRNLIHLAYPFTVLLDFFLIFEIFSLLYYWFSSIFNRTSSQWLYNYCLRLHQRARVTWRNILGFITLLLLALFRVVYDNWLIRIFKVNLYNISAIFNLLRRS